MSTLKQQLHNSSTHKPGFDPACPVCKPEPRYQLEIDGKMTLPSMTLADFSAGNSEADAKTIADVGRLGVGESIQFGGGATPVFLVTRKMPDCTALMSVFGISSGSWTRESGGKDATELAVALAQAAELAEERPDIRMGAVTLVHILRSVVGHMQRTGMVNLSKNPVIVSFR